MLIWIVTFISYFVTPSSMIEFKIGVILTEETPTHTDIQHVQFSSNNGDIITFEIIWKYFCNVTFFNVIKTGTSLYDDGALAVFVESSIFRQIKKINWFLPFTGIGNLPNKVISLDRCGNMSNIFPFEKSVLTENTTNTLSISYSHILMSIVNKLKWIDAILIYSNDTEFIIRDLYETSHINSTYMSMYMVDESYNNEDMYQLLHKIYKSKPVSSYLYIVVLSNSKIVRRLLTEADIFDNRRFRETALAHMSRWMLINIDHEPINDITYVKSLNNVALVNLPKTLAALDIPSDLTLHYYLESFVMRDEVADLNIHSQCLNETSILKLRTEIMAFSLKARNQYVRSIRFPVKTLMFRNNGRVLANAGELQWDGDIERTSIFFPNVANGFNGKLFIIGTLPYEPFVYLVNGTLNGLCIEHLKEMSKRLNFTYEITQPVDGEWGSIRNDSWSGLVGELQRRNIDMAFAPLAIQGIREEVMDFTMPFFYDDTSILYKKPDPRETQWRRLIEPLRWEVIVLTASFIPIVSLILFCVEKISHFYNQRPSRITFPDTCCYIYGSLFLQGGIKMPTSQTGRTIISFWWLFCIIMSATYCGNLLAFLAVSKEAPTFDTLEEMVEQDDITWGTPRGTYWENWFTYTSIPILQTVWAGIKKFNKTDPTVMSMSPATQIQKVQEGHYAYIADKTVFEMETSHNCDLYIAKENILAMNYAVGLPNNSPYTKIFSDAVLKINDAGLIQMWKQQHWPREGNCHDSVITEAKPIKWIDIQTIFYIIGGGAILGFLVLGLEWSVFQLRKKRNI